MTIFDNITDIRKNIPGNVKLVAVSKTRSADEIYKVYSTGQRAFGENRALEMSGKHPLLPSDIEWHFIGHLQTNKVKYIAPFVSMIQSVDSFKLLKEINEEAIKNNRTIECLLEFHIATEESKFGLNIEEASTLLMNEAYKSLNNIKIRGVMGMASFSDNKELVRNEFRELKRIFNILKDNFFDGDKNFSEISMGMSGDYLLAIEEGATIVRVGTAIFSEH